MNPDWHFGGRRYAPIAELGRSEAQGCTWHLLRAGEDGSRWLLQLWFPRPKPQDLDKLRDSYLQRFISVDASEPVEAHFGFDSNRAWFLQELPETPLGRLWEDWSPDRRGRCLAHLRQLLDSRASSCFLNAETVSLLPGRVVIPRMIGDIPWDMAGFFRSLPSLSTGDGDQGPDPWEETPSLSAEIARPIRGRSQELTYLKSLMFGLTAPVPMERIVILQGEEGMGQDQLGDWAAATAETEGLWVCTLEIQHSEPSGRFLARLLQSLLSGCEADFYAQRPAISRLLARRIPAYGFLCSGAQQNLDSAPFTPEEAEGALEVLRFASQHHPRLIHLRHGERADAQLQIRLRDLILSSPSAWFLTITMASTPPKELLAPLKADPAVAVLNLNRLEDIHLQGILGDLLSPQDLPPSFQAEVCRASLGNPALLQRNLELAHLEGALVWSKGTWSLSPAYTGPLKVHEDLLGRVLAGRMNRVGSAPAAAIRVLALADRPLELPILGNALGLAGDPLEETLRLAVNSRLAYIQDGKAALAHPKVRELALEGSSPAEIRRLAKILLRALGDQRSHPTLRIHLQSFIADSKTALASVMQMVEQEQPPPGEAEEMVHQGLRLQPSPPQEARLWEFLADAWAHAACRDKLPPSAPERPSAYGLALEAIERAKTALEAAPEAPGHASLDLLARLLRKEAFLAIRLRNFPQAQKAVLAAGELLKGQPFHREHPRLRLALGKIHMLQGFFNKGVRALEEGLQLLSHDAYAGPSRQDQASLLLELARAHIHRAQFQHALATLRSAQRLLEHSQDHVRLVPLLNTMAQIHLDIGQPDTAYDCLKEALQAATLQNDLELQGQCHLRIGIHKSCHQSLASAIAHLDRAQALYSDLGLHGSTTLIRAWKARTLAAMGDPVQAEILILQNSGTLQSQPTALERGDQAYLHGEIAGFRGAWKDANRLFQKASALYESAGLAHRASMAALKQVQAAARIPDPEQASTHQEESWRILESLKGPAEGSGSRWLCMEWHRAYALLLETTAAIREGTGPSTLESLSALTEVISAARELRFPADVVEASTLSAIQLLRKGEKLGARARLQEAFSSFQALWTRIPESSSTAFLGRPDIHRFWKTIEAAELRFALPDRSSPEADWTPASVTLTCIPTPLGTL